MCGVLSLESVGYWATSPDGNCGVNAVAQYLTPYSADEIRKTCLGEERQGEVRREAVHFIRNDKDFASLLKGRAVNVSSKYIGLYEAWKQHQLQGKPVRIADLLAARVWVGNLVIMAIALSLRINIIVLSLKSALLFTHNLNHSGRD